MRKLDQARLGSTDHEAVRRAAAILKEQFPVERVVLFGSKARGTATADSDIDLLVLTSRPMGQSDKAKIVDSLYDLQLELGVVLSTLVAGVEEWEHGYFQALPIRAEVEREGVLV